LNSWIPHIHIGLINYPSTEFTLFFIKKRIFSGTTLFFLTPLTAIYMLLTP
jgi:hypothetical protein